MASEPLIEVEGGVILSPYPVTTEELVTAVRHCQELVGQGIAHTDRLIAVIESLALRVQRLESRIGGEP